MTSLNRNNDPAAATRFELQTGGSSGVSSRISSVFDSLNGLEAKHQAWERSHKDESCLKDDPDVADDLASKSSKPLDGVFKRPWSSPPEGPCKRARPGASGRIGPASAAPDFKLHPERWTRYSLESVSEDDMSEASNKAAALDYLRERRLLREQSRQDDVEASGDAGTKHIFYKRSLEGDAEMEDDSAEPQLPRVHGPGKLVMPECVVGAKPFGARKTPRDSRPRSSSLPAVRSSSLISFDCADYDDHDDLEVDEAEDDENVATSTDPDAGKKAKTRALRTRAEDEDD